jgi:hypothetical protein
MTEIQIEKKTVIWPWLLLAGVILAVLIYFLFASTDRDKDFETQSSDLINIRENNSTVAGFTTFVNDDASQMTFDHSYTNQALLKLIQAVEAMAAETGYDIQADLDKAKEHAKSNY